MEPPPKCPWVCSRGGDGWQWWNLGNVRTNLYAKKEGKNTPIQPILLHTRSQSLTAGTLLGRARVPNGAKGLVLSRAALRAVTGAATTFKQGGSCGNTACSCHQKSSNFIIRASPSQKHQCPSWGLGNSLGKSTLPEPTQPFQALPKNSQI